MKLRRLLALALVSSALFSAFEIINDRGGLLRQSDLLSIGREWIETRSPAKAAQGSLCMPTTGTVSGLAFANDVNAAIAALVSANSGSSAPTNTCAGTPVEGQLWIDTSASPHKVKIWDGSSTWVVIGYVDPSNHVWIPAFGGGTNTIASATTTDIGSLANPYVTISGTVTITGLGSSAPQIGTIKSVKFTGILTLTHNGTSLILLNAGSNIATAAGDTSTFLYLGSGNWQQLGYQRASGQPLVSQVTSVTCGSGLSGGTITSTGTCAVTRTTPTVQIFNSGSGATYTTAAGATYIKVHAVAGGGGGGGGGAGGTTSFNSVTAIGGSAGTAHGGSNAGTGGAGGSGGSGSATLRIVGSPGHGGATGAASAVAIGGAGGSAPFFSGGGSGGSTTTAGATNTGAGGGGGGNGGGNGGDGGGGSGEYYELIIGSPAATYTYTVGAAGTAGGSGSAGGAGRIVVEEFYN